MSLAEKLMVCDLSATTLNVWVTGVAAGVLALPPCEAVTEQVPRATMLSVLPLTVQTLVEPLLNVTASPELAQA